MNPETPMRSTTHALVAGTAAGLALAAAAQDVPPTAWDAPDRAARVAAIIPGRRTPALTPETLFADWTRQQVERWHQTHPAVPPEDAYAAFAAARPTDAELTADFPVHISPFGRLHGEQGSRPSHHVSTRAESVLRSYCPVCGSFSMRLAFDPKDPFGHAVTTCCRTDFYARAEDWPPGSPLKPNATARFLHLDDTWVEVPCTVYKDSEGTEWDLFFPTIFAHQRWLEQGCNLVRQYMLEFKKTADPVCAHKIAVLLDRVADTYYGLPLASNHNLCRGRDGLPLTRAEWEAVPRPAIFEVSYLGAWSRRQPYSSPGWLNMMHEHIWVEPFARVRHHPAFREVSRRLHGDPDALDRKIRVKLLRELSLMFQSVFSQKLLHNYQEAVYIDLWLLGILTGDRVLTDFAGPCQELSMYNHTYQDGMNGEGAPNYMAMPGSYYYPVLRDPDGWLQYQPSFLEDNPFYWAASSEMFKAETVRGLALEWGDQHQYVLASNFLHDPDKVREREGRGSRNWPGYGVGVIRVGGPGHRQEVGLAYTRASLHNAQDALSLECWVDGVPVMRRGGYAAWWTSARLQWDRPEFQALRGMGYPCPIEEADYSGFDSWSWVWAHSPLCQNTLTVDEIGTGKGWGDNRGYGECITFKGGEPAGTPGSGFQVLDVLDHYSWARVGKTVREWRRALLGVEGPGGRPYVVDITHLAGGRRHTFYNQAWAARAEADLPPVSGEAPDLAAALFGETLPEDTPHYRNFRRAGGVQRAVPDRPAHGVVWAQDYGAWGPRDPEGGPYRRPVPEDAGRVRLRFLALDQGDGRTELLSARGPWIGWLRQTLPGGQRVDGCVAFAGARDFLIEHRTGGTGEAPLESTFVHVLEGFREGEASAISGVRRLAAEPLGGAARQIVALSLQMAAGHTDTVLFQSGPGTVRLPEGLETDARYALVRRGPGGEVLAADVVRGTFLRWGGFAMTLPGEFTGVIVDVIGDLTGTRRESAVVIRPDAPWPAGANLRGRQLNIRVTSDLRDPCDEGYRIAGTSLLAGGLVRVDLQDYAPFAVSWHEVTELPADRPRVIRTWRPLVDHGNSPWYNGLPIWFPERGLTFTIRSVNEVGGGYGGDTVELVEDVNLSEAGIRPGDWFVVCAVRPGLRVCAAGDAAWRREPGGDWPQYSLRGTGTVSVSTPELAGGCCLLAGGGPWRELAPGTPAAVTFPDDDAALVLAGRPGPAALEDAEAPQVEELALDGKAVDPARAADLGWVDPPREVRIVLSDAGNPLDERTLKVTLNGRPAAPEALAAAFSADRRRLTLAVDLEKAGAADRHQPRRHSLVAAVADRSVRRNETVLRLSCLTRVPPDPAAVYLSDLKPLKAFAHGGPNVDRNYSGGVSAMGEALYPRCLLIHPEQSPGGAHGEMIFEIPPGAPRCLLAEVGIEAATGANGSAVFMVQRGAAPEGPWETLYTSPVMRGGMAPARVAVPLGEARCLRLYTTDAGDGIHSDHALWGAVRLGPAP